MKKRIFRSLVTVLVCLFVCGLGVSAATVGDVNGDAACTVADALLILRSILNDTALDGADVTGDGKVSLADVLRVIKLSTAAPSTVRFAPSFAHTDTYIYRVGNRNAVALGSLFTADGPVDLVTVTVRSLQADTDVSGIYTADTADWTKGTLTFSGSGPVEVTITDGSAVCSLLLEVVDGKNVTAFSELVNGNCVLLGDITMRSGGNYYLSGATLYGNGFTFDVSAGKNSGGIISNNYLISLVGSTLDNVKVIGEVYTEYGIQAKDAYNNPVVLATGTSTIANCYIANCASPVRVNGGSLLIRNTTLAGGNFANLDIRNGSVVLEDVITVNQASGNDTAADGSVPIALGIVIYYENVLDTTTLTLRGSLTQYNHLSDNDQFSNVYAQELVDVMLGAEHTDLQLTLDGVTYANSGIIVMSENMEHCIIDERADKGGYTGKTVYFYTVDGYAYTAIPTAESVRAVPPAFTPSAQYPTAPAYTFDFTGKNFLQKTDGSNDYCYADGGTVLLSMDAGDTFLWDTDILTLEKNGHAVPYTVSMNGIDYTGKKIPFSAAGDYTVLYTYTDTDNYTVDENGSLTAYSETYTRALPIKVSAVRADAKSAVFTFGSGTETERITVGNNTYVSAVGVTEDDTTWSYAVVGDEKIYYPIVDVTFEDYGTKFRAHYPVFDGVISITDHTNDGTGDTVVYDASAQDLPGGLSVVKGVYKARDTVAKWYDLGEAHLSQVGANKVFKYASASDAPETPDVYGDILAFKSPEIEANRAAYITLVQYQYTDATGASCFYFVGYNMPQHNRPGGCVTADTCITLADGTKKRIDAVTAEDELLVWNFFDGAFATAPAAILFDHGYGENTVITLTFSDGTVLKLVNLHQLFDADLASFVTVTAENAAEYIGHRFITQSGSVTLTAVAVSEEYTKAYGIISARHYNLFTEGLLSTDFMEEDLALFNCFTVGKDLRYDAKQLQADIERYGLYTFADFAAYLTYEEFVAFGCPYMKVAVGKGQYTFENILMLIDCYLSR